MLLQSTHVTKSNRAFPRFTALAISLLSAPLLSACLLVPVSDSPAPYHYRQRVVVEPAPVYVQPAPPVFRPARHHYYYSR
jgi:hypothetical protein